MDKRYAEWIVAYEARMGPKVLGRCHEAVAEMLAVFPELREVRGHTFGAWGKRAHVWCVAPDGAIVDPTRSQYPGPIMYEVWKPGDEIQVGRCMECGEVLWACVDSLVAEPTTTRDFCDERCERRYGAYLHSGIL